MPEYIPGINTSMGIDLPDSFHMPSDGRMLFQVRQQIDEVCWRKHGGRSVTGIYVARFEINTEWGLVAAVGQYEDTEILKGERD